LVSDNGVGLPDDFATIRKNSLGLQLASDLAKQIGGNLEVSKDESEHQKQGAQFSVIFSIDHGKQPS
jgi:two-component sensor histidine kinase